MKHFSKMHIDFDPSKVDWTPFSDTQSVQFGGYNIFRGVPYQRGAGVGSVFRSLFRYLMPIGRQIGSAIGKEGLETGNRVLSNIIQGSDLKESLASEGKTGLKNLLEKAANKLDEQKGRGFDFKRYRRSEDTTGIGKPKRTKRINKLQSSLGPPTFLTKKKTGRKNQKRLRIDSLGTY